MPDNIISKDRVLEIYNAEKGALDANINAKTQSNLLVKTFEKKIDDVLRWSFFKTKEKKIQEFLNLYQEKLRNYDTDYPRGNEKLYGKELTGILLKLREALKPKPDQKFNKGTWKDLKIQFTDYREKQEGPIKTMNEQVKELTTSIEDIHKCKDKDDTRLAVILKRDFDKDNSRKTSKDDGYSDYFYVNIDKKIKGETEFEQVGKSIKDRVGAAEERIKESEKEDTKKFIELFKNMVDTGKITREQFGDFRDEQKSKIGLLFPQAVASQVNDSQRSLVQETTNAQEGSALPGGQSAAVPPLVVVHADGAEKAKQEKEKEIFENKVTVGAEVAAIGGAALLGAVTIGTGGLFLPIAVGVGTVVAGAIAISEQEKIGKQTEAEKSESDNEIQKTIQKHVVDNPSKIVTKPVIEFGESVLVSLGIKSKEDQSKSK